MNPWIFIIGGILLLIIMFLKLFKKGPKKWWMILLLGAAGIALGFYGVKQRQKAKTNQNLTINGSSASLPTTQVVTVNPTGSGLSVSQQIKFPLNVRVPLSNIATFRNQSELSGFVLDMLNNGPVLTFTTSTIFSKWPFVNQANYSQWFQWAQKQIKV